MLLNLLLNNLPISFEGPSNRICTHVRIKVNVFVSYNIDHTCNYVEKSMQNCSFIFFLGFVSDIT